MSLAPGSENDTRFGTCGWFNEHRRCRYAINHEGPHSFQEHERPPPQTDGGRESTSTEVKLRYDLIPPEALALLAEAYTIGACKHGDREWEKGRSFLRVFASLMRHAWAWRRGERRDPDGQHHLAAVAFQAFTLMALETSHPEMDDRPCRTQA